MVFEINDLKGFFILVLFAIPRVASTNINCSGRAFHCVNSTHFMICVDLGGGISTTIDDFVIPCPATTVCHENNIFECDFPDVTTPPLHVLGVTEQSDISETTLVTNSVITTTPTSDITDVFKENLTTTTLSIPEDVTPVVKLEILENIMNSDGVNSANTTETSFNATSNFMDSAIETVTDKQISDNIITTLTTDNNYKNLGTDVETSTHESVHTLSTDKSIFFDTATSVIGLINLISTEPPTVVSIKPSYNVLTSSDISKDYRATTTEIYDTKEVTILSEKDNLNSPTDITEKSVITTEVNKAIVHPSIFNDTSDQIKSKNQLLGNVTIAEQNKFDKGNTNQSLGKTNKIVSETTAKYAIPIKIVNIFEPTVVAPQTTTDNTLVSLGPVDSISAKPKHNLPTTNDYIDNFYGDTVTSTTHQIKTKLETILSEKPVMAEITSTTPIASMIPTASTTPTVSARPTVSTTTTVSTTPKASTLPTARTTPIVSATLTASTTPTVSATPTASAITRASTTPTASTTLQADANNGLISDIVTVEKVTETLKYSLMPETVTIASTQTSTANNFVSITTEDAMDFTTDTISIFETLFNNDSPVEKQTTVNQPLEVITTETPKVVTNIIHQTNGNLNKTMTTTENISADTISTIEINTIVNNSSNTDNVNDKVTAPISFAPTTAAPLQNVFTIPVIEVNYELRVKSVPIIASENYVENVKNDTFLNNKDNTLNTTVKTEVNASSLDGKSIESTTIKYLTIDMSPTESLQAVSTKDESEAKNEFLTRITNADESNLGNNRINAPLTVNTTPASYKVLSDSVTTAAIKDLTSQSDIARKITHETTEKILTDSVDKITAQINQQKNMETVMFPDNLNTDQSPTTVQDVLSMTTSNMNNIEPTPIPSNFAEKIQPNDIIKYVNKNNMSTINAVNTQDVLLSQESPAAHYVPEITKNPPVTSDTTRINVQFEKVSEPIPTNAPELVDVNTALTPDYNIDTTSFTNFGNDGDVTSTTLSPQEVTSSGISDRLNATSATVGLISEMVPVSDKSVGSVKDTGLDTQTLIDLAYSKTTISQVDADVNKTTTSRSITDNINDNTTTPPSLLAHTIKDENTAFNIVNSSGSVMPRQTLQLTSSYPSLLNDNIKSHVSQTSSSYVTATDNGPDNDSVRESLIQKNPEVILSSAEPKIMNSVLPTANTHTPSLTEINTAKNKDISTELPVLSTIEVKNINPKITDYVTEKPNDYLSTEAMIIQSKGVTNVQADFLVSPLSSGSGTVIVPNSFTTLPVYNEVTTIEDNAASSTQTTPEIVTDININMKIQISRLTSKVAEPQTTETESLLPISELPVAQTTTESTRTTSVFVQSTPVVLPGVKTVDSPQYLLRTLNSNIPQLMSSLPIAKFTTSPLATESTYTTILAQSTSLDATGDTNQSVPEIQITDLPQYLTSTVDNMAEVTSAQRTTKPTQTAFFAQTTPSDNTNQNGITTTMVQNVMSNVNNNVPQSMSSLNMFQATASPMIIQSTDATLFAQTTPLYAPRTTNPGVLPKISTIDLPKNVMSKTSDSISKLMPTLPISGVTTSQITTEPTHTSTTFADTTPLAPGKTDQNILYGILTKDLPQYVTTTVTYNNPQSTTDIKMESISDSVIAPDTMVETIKIVGDNVSQTHLAESMMSDAEPIITTVSNADDSIKSFTNHESIVIRATSKTYEQNTPSGTPIENNKAEIVNHTESNWMPSDVNIESIKIKDTSKDEDLESSVLKSISNVKNKTLVSASVIITNIQPQTGILDDKFKSTTVATYYKQAELGAPENVTQSNTVINKENKNTETNSSVKTNIETIDVKKYQDPFDSKNTSDKYSINNAKTNITPHSSLQNNTINDELEQHLTSTNHTITAEVQSHFNESDKQSNKTSYELTLNVTSIHNQNLKSTKLNASSKNTIVNTLAVSGFNCSNFARGKYADKKDCRKFYTCIGNLQPILGTCPNNTVFSEINKQCTRNLSHCVRNNQFRCLFEGRFSDFFKDNIYYICVKNRIHGFIRYKLQCQNNYHLNKDLVKCEKNEEISTQVSSVSETINDESMLKPKSEKIVSSDNFECEKEGKFPYVKDCSKYYVCTKIKNVYRRKIVKCASDEVFDKEKKKCVESDSGEC